jgi:bifunctional UDP-N-acetylglucosamine pyrophosphorylase / glucosamine-1-phosphate N-acetyltransferase
VGQIACGYFYNPSLAMAQDPPLHILILAGGESTRIGTGGPKALLDLCGRPLLEHIFAATEGLPDGQRAIVLGPKHRQPIENWMEKAGYLGDQAWKVALQPVARGTGDAVACGLSQLPDEGRLLILCGDTPLLSTATLSFMVEQPGNALLTALVDDPTGYGRILRSEGEAELLAIVEQADADEEVQKICEINAGVYLLDIATLRTALTEVDSSNAQGEFYLPDAAVAMLQATNGGVVCLEEGEEEILGINTLAEFAMATSILRNENLRGWMEQGVIIDDPFTTFIELGVQIGSGTRIMPFSVLRHGATVGRDCVVGPFAHLRTGTILHDGAQVGNFVETKNAELHEGAKSKHLTYLGDAVVGAKANIGCGTITANYDGKRKHKTIIGERAFIGSGTVLVAPVNVGNDAMTAAGSVVTKGKDVPDGGVVAGVPARPLTPKS